MDRDTRVPETPLCYAMLCYAMLCYAMLCYAMLCYAMLCAWIEQCTPLSWYVSNMNSTSACRFFLGFIAASVSMICSVRTG